MDESACQYRAVAVKETPSGDYQLIWMTPSEHLQWMLVGPDRTEQEAKDQLEKTVDRLNRDLVADQEKYRRGNANLYAIHKRT